MRCYARMGLPPQWTRLWANFGPQGVTDGIRVTTLAAQTVCYVWPCSGTRHESCTEGVSEHSCRRGRQPIRGCNNPSFSTTMSVYIEFHQYIIPVCINRDSSRLTILDEARTKNQVRCYTCVSLPHDGLGYEWVLGRMVLHLGIKLRYDKFNTIFFFSKEYLIKSKGQSFRHWSEVSTVVSRVS